MPGSSGGREGVRVDLRVLDRSPDAGDAEAVDGLVAGFFVRADRFASRAVSVRAAGDSLVAASVGQWASALGERSVRLASGLDDAAGGCRQVAQVLAGYGAALRALQRQVAVARDEVATARARAVAARERYAVAALAGGGATVPWSWTDPPAFPAVPTAATELRAWRAAVDAVAAGLREFAARCTEREELDRSVAARLAGVDLMTAYAPGTGVGAVIDVPVVQALAAAGAGTVSTEQRRVLAGWFADAVTAVSDDPQDQAAVQALSGFLDAWGADAGVMAALFAGLGGQRTVRLLAALGDAVRFGDHPQNGAIASVGAQVRAALAAGSQQWSDAQADEFADALFGREVFSYGTASILGYLFADPDRALMSAAFTVAVADRIDAWEREHGNGRLPQGVHQPGYWLAAAAQPGSDPRGVLDPAAGVFATLSRHPAAGRDWLTGTGLDWSNPEVDFSRDRISYWFGQRDWSLAVSDGFAGVGALWAGVQAHTGAPQGTWQVATLNDAAFEYLQRNPSLQRTENISTAGSFQLAEALAAQLVSLVEVGGLRGPRNDDLAWETVSTPFDAGGVVAASVTRTQLATLLAAATSEPTGRRAVQDALLAYEVRALGQIASGPASASEVLTRVAVLWAVAEGATTGATEAELQRAADAVRDALGLARKPVDTVMTLVPHPIVAIGVDAATDHLESLVVQRLQPGQVEPVSLRPEGADPMRHFFTSAVARYRELGLWDKPVVRTDASDGSGEADGQEYFQRYEDTVTAMRTEVREGSHGEARAGDGEGGRG